MTFSSRRSSFWLAALAVSCSLLLSSAAQSQQNTAGKRRVVEQTAPAYPALAREMALAGVVRVEAVVSPTGTVKTVDVKGGHPILVQAAVNAVRTWRWGRPPMSPARLST